MSTTDKETNSIPLIVIDGPAGVGKGTLAKQIAENFQLHYLDSGAVYRVLAWLALQTDVAADQEQSLVALIDQLSLEFPAQAGFQAYANGQSIDEALRTEACSTMASKIAVHPQVRAGLLDFQRSFYKSPGLVGDGRDLGTVVFPNASVKIFLDASPEERAQRRYKQLIGQGISANFDHLFAGIRERDQRDRTRSTAPLVPASDAWVIDSTEKTIEDVINLAVDYIRAHTKLV